MHGQVPNRVMGWWFGLRSNQDVKFWTYIALLLLGLQNMTSIILQHKVQSQPATDHGRFEPLSGIIMIEIFKFTLSTICVMWSDTGVHPSLRESLRGILLSPSSDATVSALLFTAATILQSVGAYYLDLIPYLVLSQLKTILTPLFARICPQELALHCHDDTRHFLTQLGSGSDKLSPKELKTNTMVQGAFAMLLAGVFVALACLCIERTMKKSGLLFLCNAQLAAYSSSFALVYFFWLTKFSFTHFFSGFSPLVWIYIVLQVSGGFLVAWCVQMTSTVTKNYAQGLGFVLAVFVPRLVAHEYISIQLLAGVGLVLASVLGSTSSHQRKSDMDALEDCV
ncbi:Nucleotide-sugar transporter [Penicillium verrucosum]|uniref:Nucleotide-sugar transporter n=1 Tax=Penicillium verrucosum TaxID=60171 RepID=UPI002545BB8B|nr:Nucleotide-sugar transporter [Penicillium verrucosum]KAJ5922874.1 Nucleotide-sugar transporter [Penicillium verrucosum]